MARRSAPLELVTETLFEKLADIVKWFPKQDRDIIGSKAIDLTLDMLDCIVCATDFEEMREKFLRKFRSDLNRLEVLLKYAKNRQLFSYMKTKKTLANEKKENSFKKNLRIYDELCALTDEIAKQQHNWYRSITSKSTSVQSVNPYTLYENKQVVTG